MAYARDLLQAIGLEGDRIRMVNISSAMGGQFALTATEITEQIKQLGPNPLKKEGSKSGFSPAGD